MGLYKLQRKIKIEWSSNFAYAIGLITSDGYLASNERHIGFVSKEIELIENFKLALLLKNKVTSCASIKPPYRKWFVVKFGDKVFYKFLNKIGLTKTKSKTIQSVKVPNRFFHDFIRGLFDGDGSFYSYWDKRWSRSFGFKLSFASASLEFIEWLKKQLTELYGVKGYIHKGAGVFNLEYVKGDSKKLFYIMYGKKNILYLKRKYEKIKTAINQDEVYGLPYLQKHQSVPG